MNTIRFNCPFCGQRGQAPAALIGELVTCPGCSKDFIAPAARKAQWFPGAALITAGVVIGALTLHFQSTWPTEATGASDMAAIVLIACGLASLLWLANEWISHMAGPLLILAGALILFVALFYGSLPGDIAGGFIMVTGAVLLLRKRV